MKSVNLSLNPTTFEIFLGGAHMGLEARVQLASKVPLSLVGKFVWNGHSNVKIVNREILENRGGLTLATTRTGYWKVLLASTDRWVLVTRLYSFTFRGEIMQCAQISFCMRIVRTQSGEFLIF
jgi:hypothetical protein